MSEVTDVVVPILQQLQMQMTRMESSIDQIKDDLHNLKVRMTM